MASIFKNTQVTQIASTTVVSIEENTTVEETFKIFSQFKILSAPVVRESTVGNFVCCGSVDVLDLVRVNVGKFIENSFILLFFY